MEKIEKLIKEYKNYAQKFRFKLNPERKVMEMLVEKLIKNEEKYGARYCPCCIISGNPGKDKGKICPCEECPKEVEKDGYCHCRLFVK